MSKGKVGVGTGTSRRIRSPSAPSVVTTAPDLKALSWWQHPWQIQKKSQENHSYFTASTITAGSYLLCFFGKFDVTSPLEAGSYLSNTLPIPGLLKRHKAVVPVVHQGSLVQPKNLAHFPFTISATELIGYFYPILPCLFLPLLYYHTTTLLQVHFPLFSTSMYLL